MRLWCPLLTQDTTSPCDGSCQSAWTQYWKYKNPYKIDLVGTNLNCLWRLKYPTRQLYLYNVFTLRKSYKYNLMLKQCEIKYSETLTKCWASVKDGGSALTQHWVNVSCLLGKQDSLSWWRKLTDHNMHMGHSADGYILVAWIWQRNKYVSLRYREVTCLTSNWNLYFIHSHRIGIRFLFPEVIVHQLHLRSHMLPTVLLWKANINYLLTWKSGRYCLLALHGSEVFYVIRITACCVNGCPTCTWKRTCTVKTLNLIWMF